MSKEEYLGDGLYASFNGYMFILRAPRSDGEHWVALEPEVMWAFDEYRKRTLSEALAPREQDKSVNVFDLLARYPEQDK